MESELCDHKESCAIPPPAEQQRHLLRKSTAQSLHLQLLQQKLYVPLICDSCLEQANTILSAVPEKYM